MPTPNPIDAALSGDPFAAFGGHATTSAPANPIDAALSDDKDPFAALSSGKQNPIDAALSGAKDPFASLSQNPIDVALSDDKDPFAAYGGHAISPTQDASTDPFAAFGGRQISPPPLPDDRFGQNEAWYARPISTYLGIPESREGAEPIERGAEKFASSLTNPLSLGLLLVTGGVGSLAEGAGAATLEDLAPEVASKVVPAAKTISRLAHVGFTGSQIYQVAKAVPRIGDAIRAGDYDTAKEMATQALLSGATAAMSAKGLAAKYGLGKDPIWTGSKEVLGQYQNAAETANVKAKLFEEQNKTLLKNKPLDMAARLYHEAGGDPATLDQWKQDLAADKNIKPAIRDKYVGLLEQAKTLPSNVQDLSSQIRGDYATDLQRLRDMGKFDETAESDPNYSGTHTYVPDDEGESNLRPVGFKTKNPAFTKARSFDTIVDALQHGFEPTETGLAAARADYIRRFGQLEGTSNAEDALMSQKAEDNLPMAVSPAQVQRLSGKPDAIAIAARDAKNPTTNGDYLYHGSDSKLSSIKPGSLLSNSPAEALEHGSNVYAVPRADVQATGKEILLGQHYAVKQSHPVIDVTKAVQDPDSVQQQRFGSKSVIPLPAKTDVSTLPSGSVIARNGKLFLDVSDYKPGPDVFLRYRFRTLDQDGQPVFDKAPLLVHPDAASDVNRYFQDESAFRQMPLLNGLLKASSGAKKTLLSLSPFHWNTEYLRGLQMGLSPLEAFKPEPLTPDRPAVAQGTKYGLALLGDSPARSMMAEGTAENADFLKRVPGIGPVLSGVEDKLFGDYIPRLKAATYEKLSNQIAKRHPNWTEQQVGTSAAQLTNAAYGGLNWKQLGVSLSSQDALRLAFLAPDFGGSQLLFAKEGLGPNASAVGQSLGRIALYNFGVARVLNLLVNGHAHLEHPFGVVSPDNKHVFSVRTMPEDIWHGLSDPQGFTMNRMNPLLTRTIYEGLSGRNQLGQRVDGQRQVLDMLRNITPISVQNFIPALRQGPDQSIGEGGLKALGVAEQSNQTSAQKLASQLSADRVSSVALPADQLEHYHRITQLEDALRSGAITQEDVEKSIDAGEISFKEERQILANVKQTRGLDPLTAKMVARSNRLPLPDFLKVYRVATPPERSALLPVLLKKKRAYLTEAYRDKTPAERTADPMLGTITRMFPAR